MIKIFNTLKECPSFDPFLLFQNKCILVLKENLDFLACFSLRCSFTNLFSHTHCSARQGYFTMFLKGCDI